MAALPRTPKNPRRLPLTVKLWKRGPPELAGNVAMVGVLNWIVRRGTIWPLLGAEGPREQEERN